MRILLDTHAFIWWDDDPTRLSSKALAACHDTTNTLVLSVISVWEMQIKVQLGKLKFNVPLDTKIRHQQQVNGIEILDVSLSHVLKLDTLADHHRDPFDRLLIAQALHENIQLISHDPLVALYPVNILW